MFFIPTPFLSNEEEKKIDKGTLCQEILKKISLNRLKESRIGISIPIFSPVITTVILPRINKKELEAAALTEARRKMIPLPGPNSIFETAFLGEIIKANIPRYEVLVVREEKEFVSMALGLFKEFGLSPHIVTPTCASLGSMFARKAGYKNKEIVFVDVGYSSMNISISRNSNTIFNRNVSFGCKDIIQGLASGLGVSYQHAEEVIFKNGVPDVNFDPKDRVAIAEEIMRQKYEAGTLEGKSNVINPLELRMLMEPFLERIVQEIRRTFIYFKERYGSLKIEKIFFLGGGVLINNLVSIVGKRISPFPEIIDADKVLENSSLGRARKEQFPLFPGAIGLALSAALKKQAIINFLPLESKRKEEIAIKRSVLIALSITVSSIFFLGWINFWIININVKKSLERVNFEIGRFHNVDKSKSILLSELQSIKSRNGAVSSLMENRKDLSLILSALAVRETDQMFFSYLYIGKSKGGGKNGLIGGKGTVSSRNRLPSGGTTENKYVLKVKVNVLGSYEEAYGIMNEFTADLKKRFYFDNIKLIAPDIGTIVPTVRGGSIGLTGMKWRKFTVKADLKI